MSSHRSFTLRTLCVVVACICVFSAGGYYARLFVTNVIQLNTQANVQADPIDVKFDFTKQVARLMCNDPEWKNEITKNLQVVEVKLQSGKEDERVMAALILGEMAKTGSDAEKQLLLALDAANPPVKRALIYALGSMRSERAKVRLLTLLKSTDRRIAEEARMALDEIQNPSSDQRPRLP